MSEWLRRFALLVRGGPSDTANQDNIERTTSIQASVTKVVTLGEFFEAIRSVETGNCPDRGRDAVGDDGKSLGPFQISQAYFADAEVLGGYQQVKDENRAKGVMLRYWMRYCPAALMGQDWEILARVHNGGPAGALKKATVGYWEKVMKHLLLVLIVIGMMGCSMAREQLVGPSYCPSCPKRPSIERYGGF